jgi:MOSC domain-containing protein YiiM
MIPGEGTGMEGHIVSIHIASAPGAPMTAITTAHLVPGKGIEGDRFYVLRGNDSTSDATSCDVTLVEQEALEAQRRENPQGEALDTARRNIVTRGCSLHRLIGRTFRIGEVALRGLAPHEFCSSLDMLQATSCMALSQADLRAQVLTEGTIAVGDQIETAEEESRF